ncbi:S8 family serine peptidase [Ectobacillus sp. JY-23]|uniref:S8 family serine peptidase n=1 Tax=Ectobacillus sp. JY-23 TaxID=2933872 RepID=UPI001FF6DF54|nr:S8 family serine peptidase [Ectobacillus sp. JY-23]UOY92474.1 S8 family serine peptidase [Ectobacillus sp. JY-23]
MNTKWLKVVSTSFVAGSLLVSNSFTSSALGASGNNMESPVLTPAQTKLLQEAQKLQDFRIPKGVDVTSEEPVNIIVQFKEEPVKIQAAKQKGRSAVSLEKAVQKVEESHQAFKAQFLNTQAKSKAIIQIKQEYRHAFNGVAITLPANKIPELLSSNLVKSIAEDQEVHINPPAEHENKQTTVPGEETLPDIGVDKLHEEGVTGKGVKVGVLDTGIDYNHPDLKDVYKGGYDFINNDNDPMETTYAEWKNSGRLESNRGSTYYTSHGTHVAGTIAGQNKNGIHGVQGMAPDVDLYAYRVLGPYGTGPWSGILAGIDKAVQDGMDVINLSLGSATNNPFDPVSIALNNAAMTGTIPVVSAGNSGDRMYTLGTPGAAPLPITVGASSFSITLPEVKGTVHSANSFSMNLTLFAKHFEDNVSSLHGKNLLLSYVGKGLPMDFAGKDLKDKVVVANYGGYIPDLVVQYAKQGGAAAVIFTNSSNYNMDYFMGEKSTFIPTFKIAKQDEAKLIEQLTNRSVSFSFDEVGEMKTSGDQLAPFSSRGPTYDTYDIKPEITAPGVSVYSAAPSYIADRENTANYEYAYQRMSGTSMATPHVAGITALLLQENPNYTTADVKTLLMNTADKMNGDYSVYEVGAGRVDAYEAAHADVEIQVKGEAHNIVDGQLVPIENLTGSLSFGAQTNTKETVQTKRQVTIANHSAQNKQFDVEVVYHKNIRNVKDAKVNGVELIVPKTLSVAGNAAQSFEATLQIAASAEYGAYEGYVILTNPENKEEQYQIPFGARKVGEGFKNTKVSPNTLTNIASNHTFANNKVTVSTEMMSPNLWDIQVFLKDTKTGQRLGLLGWYLPSSLEEGMEYKMQIDGRYLPFSLSNPNVYGDSFASPRSGEYIVEVVGRDVSGKTFTEERTIYIDNKMPDVKMLRSGGVYEVGTKGISIGGRIQDTALVRNPDGENAVYMFENVTAATLATAERKTLPLDDRGIFTTKLALQKGETYKQVFLLPSDAANNGVMWHPDYSYTLVKKGTPYVNIVAKQTDIHCNEEFKAQVEMHNIRDLQNGSFTFSYPEGLELKDLKVNKKWSKRLSLAKQERTENGQNIVEVQVQANGKKVDLQDHNAILDATFKVRNDIYMKGPKELKLTNAKVQELEILSLGQYVNIMPVTSQIKGYLIAGAFSWRSVTDTNYSKLNGKLTAYDKAGGVYEGVIARDGHYMLNVPAKHDFYKMEIKMPGHFRTVVDVEEMNELYKGELIGTSKTLDSMSMTAGDVNGDDVVDVLDAIEIRNHYNTDYRNADINFDGIVNAQDLFSVDLNYRKTNPSVADAPKPKLEHNGMTMESILKELGIRK